MQTCYISVECFKPLPRLAVHYYSFDRLRSIYQIRMKNLAHRLRAK